MTTKLMTLCIWMLSTLTLTVSCVTGDNEQRTIERVKLGDNIPNFGTLTSIGGEELHHSELEGNRTLLVLFTVSCRDCQKVLPEIEKVWLAREERGFNMVVINRGEPKEQVDQYMKNQGFQMNYYYDPDRRVFNMFANQIVPRIYIANSKGVITFIWIEDSSITAQQILSEIDATN